MKVLELFAGTRSIGKAFESRGHAVYSVEWDKNFLNIAKILEADYVRCHGCNHYLDIQLHTVDMVIHI